MVNLMIFRHIFFWGCDISASRCRYGPALAQFASRHVISKSSGGITDPPLEYFRNLRFIFNSSNCTFILFYNEQSVRNQ